MGASLEYINEVFQLYSKNTRGDNLTILPERYNRVKEGGRTFSIISLLKQVPHNLKLVQCRSRVFIPFLDTDYY